MEQVFKIGVIKEGQDFYNFIGSSKMTISQAINMAKGLFKDNEDLTNICVGYDWGSEVNIIFEIDKNNPNGVLETEAKLLIKEEFNLFND